jgi:hypothetical protein
MTTDTGGPAFPAFEFQRGYGQMMPVGGMTLRDYFAAKAMQGIVANPDLDAYPEDYAKKAYQYADAMLKARSK